MASRQAAIHNPPRDTRFDLLNRRDLPVVYEYLRRRIGFGGLLLSLSVGTVTGWPNGPWVPVGIGIPLAHALYLKHTRREPGGMTLLIDGGGIAVGTLTMAIPTVTAAALCFYAVVASVLTSGRRAVAVGLYTAVWVGVTLLWSYEDLKAPYSPDDKIVIELAATVFFAVAISAIVATVMIRLRKADMARSDAVVALHSSNVQLQELVESKDRFVASVSHELRTPLTAVMGLAQELSEPSTELSGKELSEFHQLIAGEAEEVARIVEDLLVVARADVGEVAVFPKEIELGEIAAETIRATSCAANTRVAGSATAFADPIRVKQVVRNLLVNADRYGGENVRVEIRTGADVALVDVADDGAGIPGPDPERVFEAYQSAHDPGTEIGAIGLGLSVSRKLARLMGGDLSYQRRGPMSTFTLSLPLREAAPS
ncbi:MAG: HAMP domain-containing sensor histidine kinase [Acidimicrobiia bacterium]|nr:HAMP domain-containing sensor histidine kinase [Acidimicrobiia bacterium]